MKYICTLILFASIVPLPLVAEEPSAHEWFENSYAPLWAANPREDLEKILSFYNEEIVIFESGGSMRRDDRNSWLAEPMREWLAEGWQTSGLVALETKRINETTAAFTARWVDNFDGGEQEVSCGWYLAQRTDGQWLFVAYADADC